MKKWKKIVLIIMIAPFALAIPVTLITAVFGNSILESKPVLDLKKEREKQLIDIAFYSERKIKENMKDPSSFELIDRDYKFLSDTVYQIKITYSGTNSFGGRIQSKYLKMGVLKFNPKDTTFTNTVKFER